MKNFGISLTIDCEIENFVYIVDEFSENTDYGYSVVEKNGNVIVNLEILPYFNLEFISNDKNISMNVNTCYFGMGFHILVLEFIEELKNCFECEFIIKDDTNYIENNNLINLEENFDNWLNYNVSVIKENNFKFSKSVFMLNENLVPFTDEDYICTYRGVISFSDFDEISKNIFELRNRVFIFPNVVDDIFLEEGYLMYHIWNSLKDLTLVDDFDERVSLTMFMFNKLIENNVKIHLPQKFAREIYKYLGVEGFLASNFVYRKVKYDIGYDNYKKILRDYSFDFVLPVGFYFNSNSKTFDSDENSIFINEYLTTNDIDFKAEILEEIKKENSKIFIFNTENFNSRFFGYEKDNDEYNYLPILNQNSKLPENTSMKIVLNDRVFEVVVYGLNSLEIIKQIVVYC